MAIIITTTEEAATAAEVEEEVENLKIKIKKKKKKSTVGLASASDQTVKRVITMGQKARLLTLKKVKEEAGDKPLKMGLAMLPKDKRHEIAKKGGLALKESVLSHLLSCGSSAT